MSNRLDGCFGFSVLDCSAENFTRWSYFVDRVGGLFKDNLSGDGCRVNCRRYEFCGRREF